MAVIPAAIQNRVPSARVRNFGLVVGRITFVLLLVIILGLPLWSHLSPEPARVGPTIELGLPTDGRSSAVIPTSWHFDMGSGEHAALALATSNDPEAVRDLVGGTATGMAMRSARREVLDSDDAFVQVWSTYMLVPPSDEPSPLPRRFIRGNATIDEELWNSPVLSWAGKAPDGHHCITFWVGPDASPSVRAQALFVLANLDCRARATKP